MKQNTNKDIITIILILPLLIVLFAAGYSIGLTEGKAQNTVIKEVPVEVVVEKEVVKEVIKEVPVEVVVEKEVIKEIVPKVVGKTYKEGTYKVGRDIPAGEYKATVLDYRYSNTFYVYFGENPNFNNYDEYDATGYDNTGLFIAEEGQYIKVSGASFQLVE